MNKTKQKLISFEAKVAELWESGDLPYLIHLSSGNEELLINIFKDIYKPGDWVFSTHRNHYHALLAGVSEEKLLKDIKDGNSMFIFDKSSKFYTSAILGGNACIAAGVAFAIKQLGEESKVLCFLGDGAEEEGNFYEAVMMVESHQLPCIFIIEDNNRSVDTTINERSPTAFRMNWPKCVKRYYYKSNYPHAGNGTRKKIIFKK
jgi:pyruvate dehydrogenase E1 component alpha subunit